MDIRGRAVLGVFFFLKASFIEAGLNFQLQRLTLETEPALFLSSQFFSEVMFTF